MTGLLAFFPADSSQYFAPPYFVGWGTLALINAGLAQGKNKSGLLWFLLSIISRAAGDVDPGAAAERVGTMPCSSYLTPFSGFQDPCNFRTNTI